MSDQENEKNKTSEFCEYSINIFVELGGGVDDVLV